MKFNLSKDEVWKYGAKNSYAQMMFVEAGDDYIAARCLILNNLFEGFQLYSLAVEKFLKALIFLETGKRTTLKNSDLHNPYELKEELQRKADYGLNTYNDLLKRLYGHFQRRYYDNKDKSHSMSSAELREFDDLFVYLLLKIPFPPEVMFRLKFFSQFFEEDSLKYFPNHYLWATLNNEPLNKELPTMKATYKAVEAWLYPKNAEDPSASASVAKVG